MKSVAELLRVDDRPVTSTPTEDPETHASHPVGWVPPGACWSGSS